MASRETLSVAQSRKGRRPMSVQTMLRKEKEGTLYKSKLGTFLSDARGATMDAFEDLKEDNRVTRTLGDLEALKKTVPEGTSYVADRLGDLRDSIGDVVKSAAALKPASNALRRGAELLTGSKRDRIRQLATRMDEGLQKSHGRHVKAIERTEDTRRRWHQRSGGELNDLLSQQEALDRSKEYLRQRGRLLGDISGAEETEALKVLGTRALAGVAAGGAGYGAYKALKSKPDAESHEKAASSPSMQAMVDELRALGVLTAGQLEKLSSAITPEEETAQAEKSLERLRVLDKSAPTAGRMARNAAVGGVVVPVANLAWRAAAGLKGRGGGAIMPGIRPMAATSAQGAVLGLVPAGQLKLEQRVEKQKLREYVGHTNRGTLRGEIQRYTGL